MVHPPSLRADLIDNRMHHGASLLFFCHHIYLSKSTQESYSAGIYRGARELRLLFIVKFSCQSGALHNLNKPKKNTQETTQKTTRNSPVSQEGSEKGSEKTRNRIIHEMRNNPNITIHELAMMLAISDRAISKHFKKMQEQEIIRRVGADRGGYWKVIEMPSGHGSTDK